METKRRRMECHRFWFFDWWLFGRSKWPEGCVWISSGLWYFTGCFRGRWCLGLQDYERQHSSSTPSPARKHATTTVIIAVPCFHLEHHHRSSLSRIHIYSKTHPLITSVLLPCCIPSQWYLLSWLEFVDMSAIHSSKPSFRSTTRPNFSARYVARRCLHIRFDSTDNTDSVKAGQSQKYLFTAESAQPGR